MQVEANVGAPQANYRESISEVTEVRYVFNKPYILNPWTQVVDTNLRIKSKKKHFQKNSLYWGF